jgi:hypothetical protein
LTICDDIHDQILDLLQLFGARRHVSRTSPRFLFLGSYVDRGYSSFEAFAFLAFLKVKFSEKIYLLRGNHETRSVNQMHRLYNDYEIIYGSPIMWSIINSAFDHLPIAAVIDRRIFGVHGGLCPVIRAAEQIHSFDRVREAGSGPINDLLWSDPDEISHFQRKLQQSGCL